MKVFNEFFISNYLLCKNSVMSISSKYREEDIFMYNFEKTYQEQFIYISCKI